MHQLTCLQAALPDQRQNPQQWLCTACGLRTCTCGLCPSGQSCLCGKELSLSAVGRWLPSPSAVDTRPCMEAARMFVEAILHRAVGRKAACCYTFSSQPTWTSEGTGKRWSDEVVCREGSKGTSPHFSCMASALSLSARALIRPFSRLARAVRRVARLILLHPVLASSSTVFVREGNLCDANDRPLKIGTACWR